MSSSHSLWSPSSAKRWRNCHGSVVMADGAPDKMSKEAAEGTVYHGAAEEALRSGYKVQDIVGETRKADGFAFRIKEEDADYAQEYVERIRARMADGCTVQIEQRTDTSAVLGIPDQKGTIDCRILDVSRATLEIRDLKFGRGVKVAAWEDPNKDGVPRGYAPAPRWQGVNDQLGIYGVSEWQFWSGLFELEYLTLVIDQPRIGHYSEVTLSRAEVEAMADAIYIDAQNSYRLWKTHKDDATHLEHHLSPSLDACRWCPAAGSCRARARKILRLFPTREQAQYMVEIPVTAKNLPTLSGVELAKALDRVDEIENWCRAVRAEALGRVERKSPDAPPGWKIVEGRKGDRTADPEAISDRALRAMSSHCGDPIDELELPKELYTEPALKSISQIEKACKKLGDVGKAIWGAITAAEGSGYESSLITQAPGRPTLVRDFDARPELAPQPVTFELRPVEQEFAKTDAADGLL